MAGDTATAHLTRRADAPRLAAGYRNVEWFHRLQAGTGLRPLEFARLVRAWRYGGDTGVTTAVEPLTPEPALMAAARGALDRALAEMDDTAAPPPVLAQPSHPRRSRAPAPPRPGRALVPVRTRGRRVVAVRALRQDPVTALTAAWDRGRSPGA